MSSNLASPTSSHNASASDDFVAYDYSKQAAPMSHASSEKCVAAAQRALFSWSALTAGVTGAMVLAGNAYSPRIAGWNFRAKVLGICVASVMVSAYKAERASIDCVQEYQERAKLKQAKRERKMAQAATAAPTTTQ